MKTQTCKVCKENKELNLDNFHKKDTKSGFVGTCKVCSNKIRRKKEGRLEPFKDRDGYKTCPKCKVEKPKNLNFFYKRSDRKSELSSKCKECVLKNKSEYDKRPEVVERIREYSIKNRKRHRDYMSYYRKNNPKYKERQRERHKERLKTDTNYRILCSCRNRIYDAVKNGCKSDTSLGLLGFNDADFQDKQSFLYFVASYLEEKFVDGMTWENYGNPNGDHTGGWHIDHIVPCASFDLTDPEQQKECFHYTNLQPLWAFDNMSKGSNIIGEENDKS
jgi:hypothetical protein